MSAHVRGILLPLRAKAPPAKMQFSWVVSVPGWSLYRRWEFGCDGVRTREQIILNYDFDFFCRILRCSFKIWVSRSFIVSINLLFSRRNFSKSWRLTKISFDNRRVFLRLNTNIISAPITAPATPTVKSYKTSVITIRRL